MSSLHLRRYLNQRRKYCLYNRMKFLNAHIPWRGVCLQSAILSHALEINLNELCDHFTQATYWRVMALTFT